MKHKLLAIIALSLGVMVHAETFPSYGKDSVSSAFFREWYLTTDLGHYLDNYSDYVFYEAETTGEWNLGDQQVFSISGNTFKNNKYWLNDFRIDSRAQVGSTPVHTNMSHTGYVLDYHSGTMSFSDDSVQQCEVGLSYNLGGVLGGISPGTRELINLYHQSGAERTMDSRALSNRQHTRGMGKAEATYAISAFGKRYYNHAYVHVGQRRLTSFDQTGISGMYPALYYTAQLDGELPLPENNVMDHLRYILLTQGREDAYSEFLYNNNEQARTRTHEIALYGDKQYANRGKLTTGLSWAMNDVRHRELSFSRNLIDQDGEAFDPWYADGQTHEVNWSLKYEQPLLSWLRLRVDGYNSLVHFSPYETEWSNHVYMQQISDASPTPLYRYDWKAGAFTTGLLENEVVLVAEKNLTDKLSMQAEVGASLDGVVVRNRAIITPNWQAKFSLDVHPCDWFRMGVTLAHERMSYTYDEAKYLSKDYMNAQIFYPDGTLMATTGGGYRTVDQNLWQMQPSYFVVDLPVKFMFGKERRHEISILSSVRKYYNQWFTSFRDGLDANMYAVDGHYYMRDGEKQYQVGIMPNNLMSDNIFGSTPYYMSNVAKYAYNGKKVFVSFSWQSYLMAGLSTMGNGVLHNNLMSLSESSANPNTYMVERTPGAEHAGNCRLDQDRSFIARLQLTYNACKWFSASLNFKFKDGQSFSNYITATHTDANGHTQMATWYDDAKGINMNSGWFGKREDAFFNLDLRLTGKWWIRDIPFRLDVTCYNLYDFGTALSEYTFDYAEHPTYPYWTETRGKSSMHESRTSLALCIPRGLIMTLKIGLEKDN